MFQGLRKSFERQLSAFVGPRWVRSAWLAIAVGITYFLASRLSLYLLTKPDDVAVFWPAAGIGVGVLIARGPGARLPVAVGTIVASIPANVLGGRTLLGSVVFGFCNAGEILLVAVLIERYFGSVFSLGSLRQVLGLITAAMVGSAVTAIPGTIAFVLFESSTAPVLTIWYHWSTSNVPGIVAVAPVLIGLFSPTRDPAPRGEVTEALIALITLTVLSGLIIFLPGQPWVIVALIALLFPLLLWLAARCRPVFAAIAAFIVALTIVWTTTFNIGMFGDETLPITERVLAAQAGILAVSLCSIVLAALFSERRESEAKLARAKEMLEHERDNKLVNAQAIISAVAHEIRQPLTAMLASASAAVGFLTREPLDKDRVREILHRIQGYGHQASEVFDNIRALFGKVDKERRPIDLNEIVLTVLASSREELQDHNIKTQIELAPELPLVNGHKGQLREVILNLVHNAVEAMDTTTARSRLLWLKTAMRGQDAIIVSVKDTGPGIDPEQLNNIFGAFVTTKAHGTGLGLALCKMIIEDHGGGILASSDGKDGTLFQFHLPLRSG